MISTALTDFQSTGSRIVSNKIAKRELRESGERLSTTLTNSTALVYYRIETQRLNWTVLNSNTQTTKHWERSECRISEQIDSYDSVLCFWAQTESTGIYYGTGIFCALYSVCVLYIYAVRLSFRSSVQWKQC